MVKRSHLLVLGLMLLGLGSCNSPAPIADCVRKTDCLPSYQCLRDVGRGVCVPEDACAAGIYIGDKVPPDINRLTGDDYDGQRFLTQTIGNNNQQVAVSAGILTLGVSGEPRVFELDFYDDPDKNSLRPDNPLGIYAEARLAVSGADPEECAAILYMWVTRQQEVRLCVGKAKLTMIGATQRKTIAEADDVFKLSDFHTYRIEYKPRADGSVDVDPSSGQATGAVSEYLLQVWVDGQLVDQFDSMSFFPLSESGRAYAPIVGFGSQDGSGIVQLDFLRWGCDPTGGPCVPALLPDDDQNNDIGATGCITGRDAEQGCNGGGAARKEVCNNEDDDCDGLADEDFLRTFEDGNPIGYETRDQGIKFKGESCTIGECSNARIVCDLAYLDAPADQPVRYTAGEVVELQALRCYADPLAADSQITGDRCDGLDNDCNGQIDEGYQYDGNNGIIAGEGTENDDAARSNVAHYSPESAVNGHDEFVLLGEHCKLGECTWPARCSLDGARVVCDLSDEDRALQVVEEVCGDGLDNDCDGAIDENEEFDQDRDGHQRCGDCLAYNDPECAILHPLSIDCDDNNDRVNPDATELCDVEWLDENCDGQHNEGFDADHDGHLRRHPDDPTQGCQATPYCRTGSAPDDTFTPDGEGGNIFCAIDCDDTGSENSAARFPGNPEICDGIDNDCDEHVDEGFASQGENLTTVYTTAENCGGCALAGSAPNINHDCVQRSDRLHVQPSCITSDADPQTPYVCSDACLPGWGDADGLVETGCECAQTVPGLCDPAELGAVCHETCDDGSTDCEEVCDGLDNNCDNIADEFENLRTPACYSGPESTIVGRTGEGESLQFELLGACRSGRLACNDGDIMQDTCIGQVLPTQEVCNGLDDDCDGLVDEGIAGVGDFCEDDAMDIANWCRTGAVACAQFPVEESEDVWAVRCVLHEPEQEVCNTIDDDCDGRIDEARNQDQTSEFGLDFDFDNFVACHRCDDNFSVELNLDDPPDRLPPGTRLCTQDCDDGNASINPARPELCNGYDDNCNALTDEQFATLIDGSLVYNRDTNNCGGCTDVANLNEADFRCFTVPNPHGIPRCDLDGTCAVAQCDEGYVNANGDVSDGCETSLCGEDADLTLQDRQNLADGACYLPYLNQADSPGCHCRGEWTCVVTNPESSAVAVQCLVPSIEGAPANVNGLACPAPNRRPGANEFDLDEEVCGVDDAGDALNRDEDCDGLVDEDFINMTGQVPDTDLDGTWHYFSVAHCGACAHNCADEVVHAVQPTCEEDEQCGYKAATGCLPDYWDLDEDPTNGCEYHCEKSAFVEEDVCDIVPQGGGAPPGELDTWQDDDCDGQIDEIFRATLDGQYDPDGAYNQAAHCGACGDACEYDEGNPGCTDEGECIFLSCNHDYADCDNIIGTGRPGDTAACETLITDTTNCGGCQDPDLPPEEDPFECYDQITDECSNQQCLCSGVVCDVAGSPTEGSPWCVDQDCVECRGGGGVGNDVDCAANGDAGGNGKIFCVNNTCLACNPANHDGCAEDGARPICGDNGVCTTCETDGECNERSILRVICHDTDADNNTVSLGSCQICDLVTSAGCSGESPICRQLEGRTDLSCDGCVLDSECPGGACLLSGSCDGCNPEDPSTCNNPTPVCVTRGEVSNCEVCNGLDDAGGDILCPLPAGGERPTCVQGQCLECDPDDHNTCNIVGDATRDLCCSFNCEAADFNQCEACGIGCNLDTANLCGDRTCMCGAEPACLGATPYCDAQNANDLNAGCVQCRNRGDCSDGNANECVNSRCERCVPDPATNAGCDGAGILPICDAGTLLCRGCGNDDDCTTAGAPYCAADGSCQPCDADDNRGCAPNSNTPICRALGEELDCQGCEGHTQCDDGARGNVCALGGGCVACTGDTDCDIPENRHPDGNLCGVDVAGRCGPCNTDDRCGDHLRGNLCLANIRCESCAGHADCAHYANSRQSCVVHGDIATCEQCTPATDAPCEDETPICGDPNYTCEACTDNAAGNTACDDKTAGAEPFCVGGGVGCRYCESDGDAATIDPGCAADRPVCDSSIGTFYFCRGCVGNNECGGDTPICVEGQCRECEPGTDQGCDPVQPVCATAAQVDPYACRSCDNDGECTGNPNGNGGQCLTDGARDGFCEACDPSAVNHDGCLVDELCCGAGAPACERTAPDTQCASCGNACDPANDSDTCSDRACVCGDTGGPCGANTVCSDAGTCLECNIDADCGPGELCNANACAPCDPDDNEGCALNQVCCGVGAAATCQATSAALDGQCEACGQACDQARTDTCSAAVADVGWPTCGCAGEGDAVCGVDTPYCTGAGCVECLGDEHCGDVNASQCVDNVCEACDPSDHAACAANQLCCGASPNFVCQDTSNIACESCGTGCDADSTSTCTDRTCTCEGNPACGALTAFCDDVNGDCQECKDDPDCQAGLSCSVAGVCLECINDGDCIAANQPICDGVTNTCQACNNDCPVGVCLDDGSCQACDPATEDGCAAEVCNDAFVCEPCQQDLDCSNHPAGNLCVVGECTPCGNSGECLNHPVGELCRGTPKRCIGCTENAECLDPALPLCTLLGACVECTDSTQCPGVCSASNACVECNGDPDCAANPKGGVCANNLCGCGNFGDCDVNDYGSVCLATNPDICGCVLNTDCPDDGACDGSNECLAPTCVDAFENGDETDVNCGGSCVANCANGGGCAVPGDCTSGVCTGVTCAAPTCIDTVQNGDETDTDCGGSCGATCAAAASCVVPGDCASGVCTGGVCIAAGCHDGLQNGDETDIDCGGGTCVPCADGDVCAQPVDCDSGVCTGLLCAVPTCGDSVTNGTETDEDCGGDTCVDCADTLSCLVNGDCLSGKCTASACSAPTCLDGVSNGAETDVDCGGDNVCDDCPNGDLCTADTDCTSGKCDIGGTNRCLAPACNDGVLNGGETAVDCGGICNGCADGAVCGDGTDCLSLVCTGFICQVPSCIDAVTNGDETDLNCGGSCAACVIGNTCALNTDCATGICDAGSCVAAGCGDGVHNGDETDIDCGGSCNACPNGDLCTVHGDCESVHCDLGGTLRCLAPTCVDSIMNALETDIDCGGDTCADCADTFNCLVPGDCLSGACGAGNTCLLTNGAECVAPADCASADCTDHDNNIATATICRTPALGACAADNECIDGDCTDHDADAGTDMICRVPALGACTAGNECIDGDCADHDADVGTDMICRSPDQGPCALGIECSNGACADTDGAGGLDTCGVVNGGACAAANLCASNVCVDTDAVGGVDTCGLANGDACANVVVCASQLCADLDDDGTPDTCGLDNFVDCTDGAGTDLPLTCATGVCGDHDNQGGTEHTCLALDGQPCADDNNNCSVGNCADTDGDATDDTCGIVHGGACASDGVCASAHCVDTTLPADGVDTCLVMNGEACGVNADCVSNSCDIGNTQLCLANAADWCRLQSPSTDIEAEGTNVTQFYGRVFEDGVTNGNGPDNQNNPTFRLRGQIGYLLDDPADDPTEPDPSVDAFTWTEAIPNVGYADAGEADNDEYQAGFARPATGSNYDYAYRFSADMGQTWTYCDLDAGGANDDGSQDGYQTANSGEMDPAAP